MHFLFEIWPNVEKIGIPLLLIPFGLAIFSLNIYFRECKILYLMERDIKFHDSLTGKSYSSIQITDFNAIYFGFKNLSSYSSMFLRHQRFKSQIETVKGYRKMYSFIFPIIIILGTIGVMINELIIDA